VKVGGPLVCWQCVAAQDPPTSHELVHMLQQLTRYELTVTAMLSVAAMTSWI
jgi:hypothetical protein